MPTRNVDWVYVKDPHPASLANLQSLVKFMIEEGAVNSARTVSVYAMAKHLGRQHKQVASLIKDRPGFVLVESNGMARGYYYDIENFGFNYPAAYKMLRHKRIKAVEDVQELIGENAQKSMAAIEKHAKALSKPEPDLPEIILPGEGKRVRAIVEFSTVEDIGATAAIAFDQLLDRNRSIEKRQETGLVLVNVLLTRLMPEENSVQRD